MSVDPSYWTGRPASTPTVVFAGDVLGHRVVVMADDHAIVRYSEDPDQARRLYVNAYERSEVDARGLIQLGDQPGERDEQTPYLVPPGVTQVLAAEVGNSRPAWRPVRVHDGVAAGWPRSQPDPKPGCSMLMFALLAPDDPRYLNDSLPYVGHERLRSDKVDAVYSTYWWKAPSGRWYLIVGGSPDITRIRVWGQIDQSASGNTFIFRGPKSKKAPATVVAALDKHRIPARLL
jgi:hypothetical protein